MKSFLTFLTSSLQYTGLGRVYVTGRWEIPLQGRGFNASFTYTLIKGTPWFQGLHIHQPTGLLLKFVWIDLAKTGIFSKQLRKYRAG
jgi:hypothetical protein